MSKPKISIIVPVYNVEQYLQQCMDSLINQSFKDIEIIAVNDGSTDSSLDILVKYAEKDSRVKMINQTNQGLSGARNSGIRNASGDYILLVDSDDWIDLDTCEIALKVCLDHEADVVLWSYVREYEKISLPKVIFNADMVFNNEQCKKLHQRFVGLLGDELSNPENADNIVTAWGKLYRKNIIKDNNIEFIDLKKIGTYEDGLFNLYYFGYVRKAVFINKHFNHYRKSNMSALTQTYKPNLFNHYKKIFQLINQYIIDNKLPDNFTQALNNRICLSIIGLGLTECLEQNPKSTFARVIFIRQILNDPIYKKAYKKLTLRYFPLHWKMFFCFAKYNLSIGIYILLLGIKRIISR